MFPPLAAERATMRRRSDAAALARSCHAGPALAVTALASALAAAAGRRRAGVAAVGGAVLAGQLSVGWHNDWVDAERDRRVARTDKPAAADPRIERAAGVASAVSLTCCVPLSLLSGRRAAAAHLAGVALALSYNAGLKATAWSWVPYAGGFALLITFVASGRPDHPGVPWRGAAAAGLLGVGAHFANVIPDLERDAVNDVRGLPNRLGRPASMAASAGGVLAASALVGGLPVASAILAAGAAIERRRPGALFAATITVAAADAALLVARARRS